MDTQFSLNAFSWIGNTLWIDVNIRSTGWNLFSKDKNAFALNELSICRKSKTSLKYKESVQRTRSRAAKGAELEARFEMLDSNSLQVQKTKQQMQKK